MSTFAQILEARERIADVVDVTPCRRSRVFDDRIAGSLFFKYENLHRTGAFKERGVSNRLPLLSREERERGVVTASAGNHAQALAYHAARLGIPATVVMPAATPFNKIRGTRRYGADVVLHGAHFSAAVDEARRRERDDGQVMIHAFDDEQIIAGQGTLGIEIAEQVANASVVVVPIGGGGVIAGTATALHELRPDVRVFGVEAAAAPSARASRDAGRIVEVESSDTIAEGIAVKRVGELTFPIIERLVEDIVVVSEEQIAEAVLLLLEREKTLVEGAGAAPLAALLAGALPLRADDTTVAVLCGGNIDSNLLSRIIERGLVADGRIARLMVKVRDRPGALARLTDAVAALGANVLEIAHRRAFADISMGDVEIVMHLETRGRDHVQEIREAFEARGLAVEEDL